MAWPNYLWLSFNGKPKLFTKIIGTVRAALFIIREIEYSSCGSWNQLYMRALCRRWLTALGSVKALHCGGFPKVSSVRLELQSTRTSARRQLVRRHTHTTVKRHRPPWYIQTHRRCGGTDWHTLIRLSVTLSAKPKHWPDSPFSMFSHLSQKCIHTYHILYVWSLCYTSMLHSVRLAHWDYALYIQASQKMLPKVISAVLYVSAP